MSNDLFGSYELFIDGDVIVEVVDPTGEDCGCVIRHYPDGTFEDSGCFRHMPHRGGEANDEPHWSGEADE